MISICLAVLAAGGYGLGNYLGGTTSRVLHPQLVAFGSQALSLVMLLVMLLLIPGRATGSALLWGAAAGIFIPLGLLTLYRALATGHMAVIAPISGAVTVGTQVLFGLLFGERPSMLAWVGIGGVLAAIVLAAPRKTAETEVSNSALPITLSVVSGMAFAGAFICLSRTAPDAGLWPLLSQRLMVLTCLLPLVRRDLWQLHGKQAPTGALALLAAGLVVADVCFLLAARTGALSIVGPLAAMSPVAVILLARLHLHEQWSRRQAAGLALSLGSLILVATAG